MKIQDRDTEHTWSIILAGGEGERLKPFIQSWTGEAAPKQYCAFTGSRSMLEHTLARADQVSGAARKVTVIGSSHLRFAGTQVDRSKAGTVVMQPRNCDTAPGIFLPLTYVRALDPAATVAIFPSDHFVYPENRFIEHANAAVAAARELGDRVILLGVAPDAAELDYGWVEPGYRIPEVSGGRVRAVREFIEKPPAGVAKRALKRGALWNTFVMAAPVETLWQMGRDCFPAMMTLFEALSDAIGRPEEGAVLESIYRLLPPANFSSDLLQAMPTRVAVMEMKDVLWSDWGRPERIAESIRAIGRKPRFPDPHWEPARSILHSARWNGSPDFVRVARSPGLSSNPSATPPVGVL
jgi:mannose-1-phosphate guanylyltransferase